jgi:hypothetical protein
LKYQNGQDRAEIQRMHEKLSQAQMILGAAKVKAAKSSDNLRRFDTMLKKALATKRRLIAHHINKTAKLEMIRTKLAVLEGVVKQSQQQVEKAKQELEEIKQLDASRRQELRDKTFEFQKVAEETAGVRSNNIQIENQLEAKLKEEASLKQRLEAIKLQIDETEKENMGISESSETAAASHSRVLVDVKKKIEGIRKDVSKESERMHDVGQRIVNIQISEKHIVQSDPNDALARKALDLNRICTSQQAEAKALEDEEKAKQLIEGTVAALRLELAAITQDLEESNIKATKDKKAVKEYKLTEETRRKSFDDFLEQLEQAKKEVQDTEKAFTAQKDRNEKRITELQLKSGADRAVIATAKAKVADTKNKLKAKNAAVEQCMALTKQAGQDSSAKVEKERKNLESLRAKYEDNVAGVQYPSEDEYDMTADEIRAEIADLLDGEFSRFLESQHNPEHSLFLQPTEYPLLLEVNIARNSSKPESEQVQEALKSITAHCDKRIYSAKKMRMELKAAAHREEEERAAIKEAAEAEKQQKLEARENRKKRLEVRTFKHEQATIKPKRRKEKSRTLARGKNGGIDSVTKPRELLSAFTHASVDSSDGIRRKLNENEQPIVWKSKKVRWTEKSEEFSTSRGHASTKSNSASSRSVSGHKDDRTEGKRAHRAVERRTSSEAIELSTHRRTLSANPSKANSVESKDPVKSKRPIYKGLFENTSDFERIDSSKKQKRSTEERRTAPNRIVQRLPIAKNHEKASTTTRLDVPKDNKRTASVASKKPTKPRFEERQYDLEPERSTRKGEAYTAKILHASKEKTRVAVSMKPAKSASKDRFNSHNVLAERPSKTKHLDINKDPKRDAIGAIKKPTSKEGRSERHHDVERQRSTEPPGKPSTTEGQLLGKLPNSNSSTLKAPGISSVEYGGLSKSRRRKKIQSSGGPIKPKAQFFGEDCTFNFGD